MKSRRKSRVLILCVPDELDIVLWQSSASFCKHSKRCTIRKYFSSFFIYVHMYVHACVLASTNRGEKEEKSERMFNKSETKYIYLKIYFRIEKYISEIYLKMWNIQQRERSYCSMKKIINNV